jgi:hypothetical protein
MNVPAGNAAPYARTRPVPRRQPQPASPAIGPPTAAQASQKGVRWWATGIAIAVAVE